MNIKDESLKHFVAQLNKDTCIVFLEAFIDCSDDIKLERFNYIVNQAKTYKNVIASLTWENREISSWLPWKCALEEQISFTLMLDSVYKEHQENFPRAKFIDYFLLRTNFELTILKSSEVNRQWNPRTDNFLFLTGKPLELNRAFLLKKLMDAGLKDHCVWSLFVDDKNHQTVQEILSLDSTKFAEFLDLYSSSSDNIKPSESCHYGGFPYDHQMYENTSFRIISETQFNKHGPWITEKTWTTIANHHPFIMAGNPETLKKLKSAGFRTFENYLVIPDYDDIIDPMQRVDAIVINASNWLKTLIKDSESINTDVLYNIQMYNCLVQKNIATLSEILDNYKIDLEMLYQSGFFSDMVDKQWILFYNSVKDQSWPTCFTARFFHQLPLYIRKELMDVFGFNPTNVN